MIFVSEYPLKINEIKSVLEASLEQSFKKPEIEEAIARIQERFQQNNSALEVVKIADGYQFMTKAIYHNTVGSLLKQINKKKLSKAALETLAIIAYKQPVSKPEVEQIRGVNCDYVVQKLLEKELISLAGRSDGPGRALLYETSSKFMEYFGLETIKDLPDIREFKEPENAIGEPAPIEEPVMIDESSSIDEGNTNESTLPEDESAEDAIVDENESAEDTIAGENEAIEIMAHETSDPSLEASTLKAEEIEGRDSMIDQSNEEE